MPRLMPLLLVVSISAGIAPVACGADSVPRNGPVPYRVIPIEEFASAAKNWDEEHAPRYAVITSLDEWRAEFQPTVTMWNQKPTQPEESLFDHEFLVAVSRVSDAPARDEEKVLAIKSLVRTDGELRLSYSFVPPAKPAGFKVKNTLLIAISRKYLDDKLRIIELEFYRKTG